MRIEGWEGRLIKYFQGAALKEFAYGECDCVVFASDAVMEQVNIDPMFEGRGKYDNLKDGAVLIKELRGSYEGIMDYYFKRIPVTKAQRGDVVLTHIDDAPCYGIAWIGGKALFKGKGIGLVPVTIRDCEIAWRVE